MNQLCVEQVFFSVRLCVGTADLGDAAGIRQTEDPPPHPDGNYALG